METDLTDTTLGPDLRRDVRELGVLLGRTLSRQEGEVLLEQVEAVRGLIRTDREAAAELLADVAPARSRRLARAFLLYFHLANVAEQVDRGRALSRLRDERGGPLALAAERIAAGLRNTG